jgi:subfamily B ATP-binding cassette protein MsbA
MNTFWRIVSYLRNYRLRLLGAFLCSVGVAALQAVNAWLVKPVLDDIFIARNQELLMILPLIILGVAILKASFSYGQSYLMGYVGQWLVADVRQQLFIHIVRLPIRFHDANTSGRLMARVISDVNEMSNAIPSVLKDIFQQGLTFVALIGVAFYQNWKMATVVLVVLPLSGYVLIRIGKRIRKLSRKGQESIGSMASVLKEAFTGIKVVKAYGQEEKEGQRFFLMNKAFRRAQVKSSQTSAMSSPILEVIAVCGISFIIWYGGGLVIAGEMKPGEFFSFLTAMFMSYAPIRKMCHPSSINWNFPMSALRMRGQRPPL